MNDLVVYIYQAGLDSLGSKNRTDAMTLLHYDTSTSIADHVLLTGKTDFLCRIWKGEDLDTGTEDSPISQFCCPPDERIFEGGQEISEAGPSVFIFFALPAAKRTHC